jgi:hypothetical protein
MFEDCSSAILKDSSLSQNFQKKNPTPTSNNYLIIATEQDTQFLFRIALIPYRRKTLFFKFREDTIAAKGLINPLAKLDLYT